MKNILTTSLILAAFFITISGCKTSENQTKITEYKDSLNVFTKLNQKELKISFEKGKEFNHPTFVIWVEDLNGNYIHTVFITKSYASGIFGREMIGDTVWSNKPGESIQPAALPYWTFKKGKINGKNLVPTKENPYVDAYTGATPKNDFSVETALETGKYRMMVEVNQTWDWNKYWTNNKYPESDAYKHSAQPSLIYSVTLNDEDTEYYLNPIGHGDPKGESGKLYTDLSEFTTALEIFENIKIEVKN